MSRPRPATLEDLLAHGGWVRALARHLVRDAQAAADVEQQAWVSALQAPPRHAGDLRAWLARLVRRRAADARRAAGRRARHERAARRPPDAGAAPPDLLARAELRARVAQAVLGLPEPYRSTLLLHYVEEQPLSSVAALQGVGLETVRTRVRRGLALLRQRLAGLLGVPEGEAVRCLVPLAGGVSWAAGLGRVLMTLTKTQTAGLLAALALAAGTGWLLLGPGRAGGPPAPTPPPPGSTPAVAGGPRLEGRDGDPTEPPPRTPAPAGEGALRRYPALERPPARLAGAVRDERGRAAPGAVVEVRSSAGAEHPPLRIADDRDVAREAVADARGRFAIEGLPAGPYRVRARLGGLSTPWILVAARPGADGLTLVLREAEPFTHLRVRVRDGDGAAVPGAAVELVGLRDGREPGPPGEPAWSALSDAEGVAELRGVQAEQLLGFARAPDGRVGAFHLSERRLFGRAAEPAVVEVSVGAPGTLVGEVRGAPSAGALEVAARLGRLGRAYWSPLERTFRARVVDGRYVLGGLPAGTYEVLAHGGPWLTRLPWASEGRYPEPPLAEVTAGGQTRLDLEVWSGCRLGGRVAAAAGPVPGAFVRVVRDPRTSNEPDGVLLAGVQVWRLDYAFSPLPDHPLTHRLVPVAPDGRFEVAGLEPGAYRVELGAPGYSFQQRTGLILTPDAPLTLEVTLEPAGVLQGAAPGSSYLGVRRPGAETFEAIAIVGPSGLFTFAGLPAGEHELAEPYWGRAPVVRARVRIEPGRTTWIDLWNQGEHGVRGRVLLGSLPLAGAGVGRGGGWDVLTGPDGAFEARYAREGAEPRRLELALSLPEGGTQRWSLEGLPGRGPADAGVLDLGALDLGSETLEVEVVGADGRPVPGARVELESPPGARLPAQGRLPSLALRVTAAAPVDAAGRLTLSGLQPGARYALRATLPSGLTLFGSAQPPEERSARLAEPPSGRLRIRAVDAQGAPLDRQSVTVLSFVGAAAVPDDPAASQRTDGSVLTLEARTGPDGWADLPSVPAGALWVVVGPSGHGFGAGPLLRGSARLALSAGRTLEAEIAVLPQPAGPGPVPQPPR